MSCVRAATPASFDSKQFFEDLRTKGYSDTKKIDAKTFFDELRTRGVSGPATFDEKKFFDEMRNLGAAPAMVDMPK